MPTWVMIIAPLGVLSIVALTWFLGGLKTQAITRNCVDTLFAQAEPPCSVRELYLASDAFCGLVLLGDGQLAVVCRVGDGLAWRAVGRESIREEAGAFLIRGGGPTFPDVRLKCGVDPVPHGIQATLHPREPHRAEV
ncbi:MAG: hypothetical protein AAFP04_05235 [Myxococcota bacterium]